MYVLQQKAANGYVGEKIKVEIKDKKLKKKVDVSYPECAQYACCWPRPNPGSFQQGVGYRSCGDSRDKQWVCGQRDARGCPDQKKD